MITEEQLQERLQDWYDYVDCEAWLEDGDKAILLVLQGYIKGVPTLLKENDECKRLLQEIGIGYTGQPLPDRVREAVDRIKKDD